MHRLSWYKEILDFDLEEELDRREIAKGKFPEPGTGYFLERARADIFYRIFFVSATGQHLCHLSS
jgi:hypothetical protein